MVRVVLAAGLEEGKATLRFDVNFVFGRFMEFKVALNWIDDI